MNTLIGCEESQIVCKEFRALGHNAFSCDTIEPSGDRPEWHLQMDIFEAIKLKKWDMMIAFPPCTYLSNAGIGYFNVEKYGKKAIKRIFLRHKALEFVLKLYYSDIPKVAIENPVGYLNSAFRKPNQVIEPYYFGDSHKKRTCLWLKNLPELVHIKTTTLFDMKTHSPKPEPIYTHERKPSKYYKGGENKNRYFTDAITGFSKNAQKRRSKTFPGIAKAFALQWGNLK